MRLVYVVYENAPDSSVHSVHASLEGAQREAEQQARQRGQTAVTWRQESDDATTWYYVGADGWCWWIVDEYGLLP